MQQQVIHKENKRITKTINKSIEEMALEKAKISKKEINFYLRHKCVFECKIKFNYFS